MKSSVMRVTELVELTRSFYDLGRSFLVFQQHPVPRGGSSFPACWLYTSFQSNFQPRHSGNPINMQRKQDWLSTQMARPETPGLCGQIYFYRPTALLRRILLGLR